MKITFIGGGNMATAILEGYLAQGFESSHCHVVEINDVRRAFLEKQWHISTMPTLTSAISDSDVIILAVKPQQMQQVASELLPYLRDALVISIAAGIRLDSLYTWLGGYARLVRAMPNMAALIHASITGLASYSSLSPTDKQTTESVMQTIGDFLWVEDETKLDAITAISGSGPAYVFYFIEALQEAAETLGLSPEQAKQLSLKTFEGASHLAALSHDSARTLREKVTSKGGTTEAALLHLDKNAVKRSFIEAIQAAEQRAKILGSRTRCN